MKQETRTVKLQAKVTPEVAQKAGKKAENQDISVSELIYRMLKRMKL